MSIDSENIKILVVPRIDTRYVYDRVKRPHQECASRNSEGEDSEYDDLSEESTETVLNKRKERQPNFLDTSSSSSALCTKLSVEGTSKQDLSTHHC